MVWCMSRRWGQQRSSVGRGSCRCNTGAAISPLNSFLILQGIETLPVRMDRHCENALKAAEFLKGQSQVEWVRYPALADSPEKPLVDKYMGGRGSDILSFGIQGGREAGAKFIDALQLVTRLVNIGDAKSLACHPADYASTVVGSGTGYLRRLLLQ